MAKLEFLYTNRGVLSGLPLVYLIGIGRWRKMLGKDLNWYLVFISRITTGNVKGPGQLDAMTMA